MSLKRKKFLSDNMIWLVLIALIIFMSVANRNFATVANLRTLLTGEAIKGIMAFGVAFAILTKGIDLSIGAVAALVGAITGGLVQPIDLATRAFPGGAHLSVPLSILLGLVIGALIGACIGAIIAYTHIPAFIATLGAQLICRAGAKMVSNRPVSNLPESYRFLGSKQFFGIPMIVLVFIIIAILAWFILNHTRFGKSLYAIGGNAQAATVAGINVEKTLIKVYIWCSVMAALGGILLAGRSGSSDPSTSGLNYELDAIAAATVGGTSHTGGVCSVTGVIAGILILGVINNGLVLMGVDDNMTNVLKGLIIIGSVVLDMRKNIQKV
ncbi:ribose/xylose/arabinose/galactoside ABC-type transport system permease subunit [Aequitasia blattaphilus]|uniref:ABC transporter permease n=1 Tax=Aequitasia blattaphilus TaxID=2949332 RepID=A0ABT1E9V5_9FIRM|nr:ABC transporter permease [Aequitasia blattaphilus]MCP1102610.1 ABC transporter permease [Aequitasia blattaphilus]MCR8615250.1 ABC transporter permease [Aequitasia blattaphilus]